MKKIGFIGLGHMGTPMAANLIKAGYEVLGFDLSNEACKNFIKAGGTIASSISEVAQHAEVIITSLQTGEQVKSICLGEEGLFKSSNADTLFIDCSSIDIDMSRLLHEQAIEHNHVMVDAPVSGGVAGAQAATLTIMVGGVEENFQRAEAILKHLGKAVIHAGNAGNGQAAKICNNMILGISMIAVSEAFLLAEKLGLPSEKLFQISSQSSGQCWSMTSYIPVQGILENVPANNDFQPGFTAQMMLKDLNLSQQASESVSFSTPLGRHATELYQQFVERGNDGLDFSGIIKMLGED